MNETVVKTRNQGDFKKLSDLVSATNQKHIQTKFEKKYRKEPQNKYYILNATTHKVLRDSKKQFVAKILDRPSRPIAAQEMSIAEEDSQTVLPTQDSQHKTSIRRRGTVTVEPADLADEEANFQTDKKVSMPTTNRTNRSRFNSVASDVEKAASSVHTSVSRPQMEERYQLRQLKPPKKPDVNDAPERFENVFLKRLQ